MISRIFIKNNNFVKKRVQSFKFFIFFVVLVTIFLSGHLALAQLGVEYGASTGLGGQDIRLTIAKIIRAALGFVGVILLVIIIYGGFIWMTALGDVEKVSTAKRIITNAIIGLVIILSALAITQFVITKLNEAIFGAVPITSQPGGGGYSPLSQALGGGIIADHYPARDQKDVPRNARLIVTFKEPILPQSLVKNYNDNNTPFLLSDDTATKNNNGTPSDTSDDFLELNDQALEIKSFLADGALSAPLGGDQVKVNFTPDLLIYTFSPVSPLGSPTANVSYEVRFVGGANSIKKSDGAAAFSGSFAQGYAWGFEVSNSLDTKPPQVISIVPDPALGCSDKPGGVCPRNTTVQITFSEPMDPVVTSGNSPGFTNISLTQDGSLISGRYVLANGYRTAVFTPSLECGVNSCGGTVYCFPSSTSVINGIVKAASLGSAPPQANLPYPYNGVTDVAGNSLDGNKNNQAEGPTTDNVNFNFKTNAVIDISPPQVLDVTPGPETGGVNPEASMEIIFSKMLNVSSVNSENIRLYGALASENYQPKSELVPWYTIRAERIYYPSGIVVGTSPAPTGEQEVTKASILHGRFLDDTNYYPQITEGIIDMYQNCFYPAIVPNCTADLNNPYCCNVSKCANGCTLSQTTGEPICKP